MSESTKKSKSLFHCNQINIFDLSHLTTESKQKKSKKPSNNDKIESKANNNVNNDTSQTNAKAEIDSIFAVVRKPENVASASQPATAVASKNSAKQSNKKASDAKKRSNVDESTDKPFVPGRYVPGQSDKRMKTATLDDDAFADTRGARAARKKVDGLNVYGEEELNLHLNKLGGNTEFCPFDCNCCW